MKKLSLGVDSTLENWIGLASATFGKNSEPVKFLKKKADESPNGLQEEVIADEGQLLMVLGQMFVEEMNRK
jgi:hypothetical protein